MTSDPSDYHREYSPYNSFAFFKCLLDCEVELLETAIAHIHIIGCNSSLSLPVIE